MKESEEENYSPDFNDNDYDNDINTGNDFFDILINKNRQINKERRQQQDKQRTRNVEQRETPASTMSMIFNIVVALIRAFISVCVIIVFVAPYLFPQRHHRR